MHYPPKDESNKVLLSVTAVLFNVISLKGINIPAMNASLFFFLRNYDNKEILNLHVLRLTTQINQFQQLG